MDNSSSDPLSHPILFVTYSLLLSRSFFSHSRLALVVFVRIPELGSSWYIFVCTPALFKVLTY